MKARRLIVALALGLGLTLGLVHLLSPPVAQGARPELSSVLTAAASALDVGGSHPAAPLLPLSTCTVDDDGGADYTTIQAAVDDETCTTIEVAGGDYPENVVITRSVTLVGETPTTPGIFGVEQAFRIDDPDAHVSISNFELSMNSGESGPGVYNQGTLTLTNVSVNNNTASSNGGGIYNDEGTLTLVDSTLEANVGLYGGGIYNYKGTLALDNVNINNNVADKSGGGIYDFDGDVSILDSGIEGNAAENSGGGLYNTGTMVVDSTDILNNTASDGAGYGGGVRSEGILTVTHSLVQGNTAWAGGGGIDVSYAGMVWLSNSTVSGNSANSGGGVYGSALGSSEARIAISSSEISDNSADHGGGIYVMGLTTIEYSSLSGNSSSVNGGGIQNNSGHLTITHSTINANTSGLYAGGIYLSSDGAMTLTNVTVSGNVAGDNGGGINVSSGSATLNSVTIAYNTAGASANEARLIHVVAGGNGGGIYNTSGTVTVRSTLIAENDDASSATEHPDCSGTFTSNAYNLIGNNSGCSGFNTVWDQYGTSSSPLDPYLFPLGDYGGPTLVHALKYSLLGGKSPAVDAGPPSDYPSTDQRGWSRPADGDGDGDPACDIGAVERGGTTPANPAIVKAASSPTAEPGDTITYTLTFSNAGGLTATDVVITDTLPTRLSHVSVASSGAAITQVAGTRTVWQVQDLESDEGGVITISGVLKPPQAAGAFTNDATITADTDAELDDSSDSATVTVSNVPPVAQDQVQHTSEHPVSHLHYGYYQFSLDASDPNGDALTYGCLTLPTYGTIIIDDDAVSYYPANRTTTYTDTMTYIVEDTHSLADTGVVTIVVTADDDSPTISNVPNRNTPAGVPVGPVSFTVDDPDTPLDDLTLSAASSDTALVPLGNIAFGGSGANRTVTVTPTAGMTGTATISVTVSDATSSDLDTFLLVVGPGNTPPDITSTPVPTATEDVAYTYPITATDVDSGDVLTITAPIKPLWLSLTDHGDGTATLSGTPLNSDVDDHGVTLQVEDSTGGTGTQVFTITVINVNDPPLAFDDVVNTTEDMPRSVAVLANDDDLDGDVLSIAVLGTPNYGSAAISGTLVVYTPTNRMANYGAIFTYTLSDGELTDEGQITVNVAANNDPPLILDDIPNRQTYTGVPVGPLPFTVDDLDAPLDTLMLFESSSNTALVPLTNITFGGSGAHRTITLTPTAGMTGTTIISVTVTDGLSSDLETFVLTVVGNRPPAFTSAPVTAATEDVIYTYNVTTADADTGDTLTITAVTKPGWLFFTDHHNRTATLTGKPTNTDVGDHTVILQVEDNAGAIDTQSFTITVANVNGPPLAIDDSITTDEDTPVGVDVLANDDDPDDDSLTLVSVGQPRLGSTGIDGGSVIYTPTNRVFYYSAIFTYTISDGSHLATAIVIVDVVADDDPPVISDIADKETDQGVPVGPLPFVVGDPDTPIGLLGLYRDSSNTTLVPLSNIAFGSSGANRTVTVTPTAGLTGTALITVTVFDGHTAAYDVFLLTVKRANSAPTFTSVPVTDATEDVAYTYDVTTTDADAGDTLAITAPTLPGWLALVDHGDGTATLSGTPSNTDIGDHAVALRVTDSEELTDTQTFTIVVSGSTPNQAPTADAGPDQTVPAGTHITLDGSGSADPDENLPLTYDWSQTGGPSVTLNGSTTVAPTFTAPDNATVLTFTLVVIDSLEKASAPDTIVVTVENVIYLPLVLRE